MRKSAIKMAKFGNKNVQNLVIKMTKSAIKMTKSEIKMTRSAIKMTKSA